MRTTEQKAAHAKRMREYYAANPEKKRAAVERDIERYKDDPEFAARKKASSRASYQRNREKVITRQLEVRKEVQAHLAELRKGPCIDCGNTYNPACMQFHHKPGFKKRGCVASIGSMVTLLDELMKCELLCANCHAIRHYG